MLIYKGFIKVSRTGTFYPISRITSLSPNFVNPQQTLITFNDGEYVVSQYPILKTIDIIYEAKENE